MFPMFAHQTCMDQGWISQPRYDDTRIRPWNKHNIRLRKDGASLGRIRVPGSTYRPGFMGLTYILFARVLTISFDISIYFIIIDHSQLYLF